MMRNYQLPATDHQPLFTLKPEMHLHLVGIGGSGISAIARVLLGRGFVVSGSDQQRNELTAALEAEGATVYEGHHADNIAGAAAVVISSAIPDSNPEVQAAREKGLPVLKRSEFLGHLMADSKGIAIAGTHGKTTTTGMVTQILLAAQLDPTVIVGGVLPALGSNGRYGKGPYFIIEADEYDRMFLGLRPEIIVITNLEHDHPDIFPTMADYSAAFNEFAQLLPQSGHLIVCADDPETKELQAALDLPPAMVTTYGLASSKADLVGLDLRPNPLGGTDFLIQQGGDLVGLARLRVPGEHNVLNALAATAVALQLGLDFNIIREGLAEFGGIGRRFQIVGEQDGLTVIDDYAHHPTEIQATLAAARQRYPGRRLWAVWQPHTYSRTKLLQDRFATSFVDADRVVALDIYRSRETDTLGMTTAVVVAAMNHPHAIHIADRRDAANYILDRVLPDDVILTLGAGDGNMVGQWLLEGLRARAMSAE